MRDTVVVKEGGVEVEVAVRTATVASHAVFSEYPGLWDQLVRNVQWAIRTDIHELNNGEETPSA